MNPLILFVASAWVVVEGVLPQQFTPIPPVYSLPKVIHDPFDVKPITDTCPVDQKETPQ